MSLREKINGQFNTALKNKNKTLVSTLRLILTAIKERDIANRTIEKKEGVKDYKKFAKELLSHIKQKPISFEVFADDSKSIIKQANIIKNWGKNWVESIK